MEEKATTIAATITTTATTTVKKPAVQRKKRGLLHMLRIALFMLRHGSDGKSKSVHVDVASKGLCNKLVGAMRPMHLQDSQSPPHSSGVAAPNSPKAELFQDVLAPPISPQHPFHPSPSSSSCDDSMSQYASAQNLQELGRSHGCDEIEEEDEDGDEMIDARAEEFIAHFYEQMRLQRLNSIDRYNEMMKRGSY